MQSENIKVKFRIPCHIDTPDLNGITYTKEAWENAVKQGVNKPIEIVDNDGRYIPVGVTQEVELVIDENGEVFIDAVGILFHGWTTELVKITKDMVTDVTLNSIGITK